MKITIFCGRYLSRLLWSCILMAVFISAIACGSGDSSDDGPVQIYASYANYTVYELNAIGAKTSRQYDIENLPDSVDAWKILWGNNPNNKHDYEIRFYPSHDLAVSSGKAIAIEAVGSNIEYPEAESKRKETFLSHQTWEEGAQDRWRGRKLPTFTGSVVNATGPMYPNWVIVGNLVILCDGID
ncbi:MAG: hypothetical protein MK032_03130, partial [Dehalococcoidia bacterium]|nr:hypothetical protein [Dehalococcoidia bacterium]